MTSWVVVSFYRNLLSLSMIADYCPDGFFDAGMLLQALRSKEEHDKDRPSDKAAHKREVGKRLRLMEY